MKKIVFSLLGVVLFLYVLLSVGINDIAASMLTLNPAFFAGALVFLLPSLFFKGLKQRLLVSPFKHPTSLLENIKIWLVGLFFGTASPAKSGDAIRALYLKNSFGIAAGEGIAAVFMERVFDLVFLFAFAFLGLFSIAMPAETGEMLFVSLAAFFVIFAAAVFLLLRGGITRFLLKPFFNALTPERFKGKFRTGFGDFYNAIGVYGREKRLLFWLAILTVISWLAVFLQFYVIVLALSINISFISFILFLPVILLVEALPVSIGGIGTREIAAVVMLGLLGVGAAVAVSFSLCVLLLNIITATAGFLLFNSMEKPL